MAWYRSGTVNVTNKSNAVVGVGTAWVQSAQVGETFLGPDAQVYEITEIKSSTSLVINPAYKGATSTAQSYAIMPTQGYLRDLAAQASALVASYAAVRDGAGAGKFAAGTTAAPSLRGAADDNTGLRFAGSDILQLITNGAVRLQIAADGTPTGVLTEKLPISAAVKTAIAALVAKSGATMTGRLVVPSISSGKPADFWTSDFYGVAGVGGLTTEGSNQLTLTCNGFRSSAGTWTSLALANTTGAAVVSLQPTGVIWLKTDAKKATGSTASPTNRVSIDGSGQVRVYATTASTSATTGALRVDGGVGVAGNMNVMGAYNVTTASSANLFVASNGQLQRSTSSGRYKVDVEPASPLLMQRLIDEAEPVWYRSLCDSDPEGYSYWGLVAESLAEIDPRFVHWAYPLKTVQRTELVEELVATGEVDEAGEPVYRKEVQESTYSEQVPDTSAPLQAEGVMYERLVVPLLWHAKQMQARIAKLEQRLGAMEN